MHPLLHSDLYIHDSLYIAMVAFIVHHYYIVYYAPIHEGSFFQSVCTYIYIIRDWYNVFMRLALVIYNLVLLPMSTAYAASRYKLIVLISSHNNVFAYVAIIL